MSSEQSKTQKKVQARRERARQDRKRKQLVNIGIIVIGALIFVGALAYPSLKPVSGLVEPIARQHPQADFNTLGDPEAPVEMVVYSDFLCVHCSSFYAETEARLIDEYVATGKVHYTYRVFITNTSADAPRAAEAAYCAADQGKFWEMHDALFANYNYGAANGFSMKVLNAIAEIAGVDTGQLESCVDANKYRSLAQEDMQMGRDLGVTATPTFFINGTEVRGAQPYETFQATIEAALAAAE